MVSGNHSRLSSANAPRGVFSPPSLPLAGCRISSAFALSRPRAFRDGRRQRKRCVLSSPRFKITELSTTGTLLCVPATPCPARSRLGVWEIRPADCGFRVLLFIGRMMSRRDYKGASKTSRTLESSTNIYCMCTICSVYVAAHLIN